MIPWGEDDDEVFREEMSFQTPKESGEQLEGKNNLSTIRGKSRMERGGAWIGGDKPTAGKEQVEWQLKTGHFIYVSDLFCH